MISFMITTGFLNSQDMISFIITTGFLNSHGMISFIITTEFLNSQDMISFIITTGSLNSQDMIRILEQWRHDFSGKHLCGGYCMDIMWCLCVEVKIHDFLKVLSFFYVSLFECKDPWMLKTVINCHVWNRGW